MIANVLLIDEKQKYNCWQNNWGIDSNRTFLQMKNSTIKKISFHYQITYKQEQNVGYHSSKEIIKSSVSSHNNISLRRLCAERVEIPIYHLRLCLKISRMKSSKWFSGQVAIFWKKTLIYTAINSSITKLYKKISCLSEVWCLSLRLGQLVHLSVLENHLLNLGRFFTDATVNPIVLKSYATVSSSCFQKY